MTEMEEEAVEIVELAPTAKADPCAAESALVSPATPWNVLYPKKEAYPINQHSLCPHRQCSP